MEYTDINMEILEKYNRNQLMYIIHIITCSFCRNFDQFSNIALMYEIKSCYLKLMEKIQTNGSCQNNIYNAFMKMEFFVERIIEKSCCKSVEIYYFVDNEKFYGYISFYFYEFLQHEYYINKTKCQIKSARF